MMSIKMPWEEIYIDAQKYFVVGVLKSKVLLPAAPMTLGSLFRSTMRKFCMEVHHRLITSSWVPSQANLMDEAVNHAMPIMRNAETAQDIR